MKIIAGLGNPGPKYETTRHNVGFLAIDRLIDKWSASGPVTKYESQVYQVRLGEPVLLVKPQTFMNLSGRAVARFFQFYQCKASDLVVIHDDLDLDPLALRLKTGGGTGGHNGLKSIDECLGKDQTDYHRIRIGIGHPARNPEVPRGMSTADYVLGRFDDIELQELDKVLDRVCDAAKSILEGNILSAMNTFNRKKEL